MPKFQFQNREMPVFELIPDGDYEFKITGAESSISKGAATKGCDQMEMKVDCGKAIIPDTLIFPAYDDDGNLQTDAKVAKFLEAKIDCFLKSTGLASQSGEMVDITPEAVLGLRGWARIKTEKFKKNDGTDGLSNKVHFYITTKSKLPRAKIDPADIPKEEKGEEIPF
jgi:hypothetical protein